MADGKFDEAARELIGAIRRCSMVRSGESGDLRYMLGNYDKLWVFKEMQNLAAAEQVPLETLRSLIRAIQGDDSAEGLADAVRIDFCRLLEWRLSTMHDQEPFETLLDACLARNYSMPEPDLGIEGWSPPPMDDRLAWRRKRIFRLLDGHPRPFDLADTVKAASETAAKQLASLMAPWAPRPLEDETKLSQTLDKEYWPEHLRPDFPYEFVGINDDAQQRRQQARDSWSKQQWQDIQPPTDEQIEAARVKLRAIENPVGKLLLPMLTTFIKLVRDSAFLTSVEAGATLAVLALRAHALLRGVDLPDRLDDVVAAGLLPCVPVDPFDGEPIRYSRERRLIWSVGTDGIDHGGIPNHDYLWQIPQWDCLKVH